MTRRLPPGPRWRGWFNRFGFIRRDPMGFHSALAAEHGTIVSYRLLHRHIVLLTEPRYVRHVFQDHPTNYNKRTRGFDVLRSFLANGLLTSEGEFWLRQRRIAQPAFHRQRIATFADTMTAAATALVDRWEQDGVDTVNVTADMSRLTLRIVGETLLSADVSGCADTVGTALSVALRHANQGLTRLVTIPPWIPTPGNRELRAALATLNRVVYDVIAARRGGDTDANDLLSLLMDARDDETGEGMTDAQLRDEVMTIFLAGHETTAVALGWAWDLIARHPDTRRRLQRELATVLDGRRPTFDDLPLLVYTAQIIKEAMRLYPPAWIISRCAIAADRIGGYDIPAGTFVFACPYVTHRLPSLWADPERFDPDRFDPAHDDRAPFTYFPFGGGPRQCIGNMFAMMEMTLIVATIAQRCQLDVLTSEPPKTTPAITLRPSRPIQMIRRPVPRGRATPAAPPPPALA